MTTITAAPEAPCSAVSIHFVGGMPGLEAFRRYTLIGLDDLPVYLLQCDDEPAIVLPVAEAFAVVDDYEFEVPDTDAAEIGVLRPEDARVLVVLLVSPSEGSAVVANLVAPIVVNRDTGAAKQIVLEGTRYSLRHPIDAFRG